MTRRVTALVAGVLLAACAAVTGIGDYAVEGDVPDGAAAANEGGPTIVPDGAAVEAGTSVPRDGAVIPIDATTPPAPPNGVECTASVTCDSGSACCFTYEGSGITAVDCRAAADCTTSGTTASRYPFACDEPSDCDADTEVCCVGLYTLTGSVAHTTLGSGCLPKGTCKKDASALGGNAELDQRESCIAGGTCATGTCTAFAYDAGGTVPKLQYCSY